MYGVGTKYCHIRSTISPTISKVSDMYHSRPRPTRGKKPTSGLVITVFIAEDNTAFFAITMFSLAFFVPTLCGVF